MDRDTWLNVAPSPPQPVSLHEVSQTCTPLERLLGGVFGACYAATDPPLTPRSSSTLTLSQKDHVMSPSVNPSSLRDCPSRSFDVIVQEGTSNTTHSVAVYHAIVCFVKPHLLAVFPKELSGAKLKTLNHGARSTHDPACTTLPSQQVAESVGIRVNSVNPAGSGPTTFTTLLYTCLALVQSTCGALFGGRVCHRRARSVSIATPSVLGPPYDTPLLSQGRYDKDSGWDSCSNADLSGISKEQKPHLTILVSNAYLIRETPQEVVLQVSNDPAKCSASFIITFRVVPPCSVGTFVHCLIAGGIKGRASRQKRTETGPRNSNYGGPAPPRDAAEPALQRIARKRVFEPPSGSKVRVVASRCRVEGGCTSTSRQDSERNDVTPSEPVVSSATPKGSTSLRRTVTSENSSQHGSPKVQFSPVQENSSGAPRIKAATPCNSDHISRENDTEEPKESPTQPSPLPVVASARTEPSDQANVLLAASTSCIFSTTPPAKSQKSEDIPIQPDTASVECSAGVSEDRDPPLLKPQGIVRGFGVGGIAVLSQRPRKGALSMRTGSVFSGGLDSDYSYSSLLTGTFPRAYSLYRSHTEGGNNGSHGGTAASMSGLLHHLQTRETSESLTGRPEQEKVVSQGSLCTNGPQQTASALLANLYKPLGRAAQQVIVSEWDRLEREEALLFEQQATTASPFHTDDAFSADKSMTANTTYDVD